MWGTHLVIPASDAELAAQAVGAGAVVHTRAVLQAEAKGWLSLGSRYPAAGVTQAEVLTPWGQGGGSRGGGGGAQGCTHLQVGDVAVNVHGGGLAVLRDVLVILRARFPIHSVDAGNGHVLIASSHIPAARGRWD